MANIYPDSKSEIQRSSLDMKLINAARYGGPEYHKRFVERIEKLEALHKVKRHIDIILEQTKLQIEAHFDFLEDEINSVPLTTVEGGVS